MRKMTPWLWYTIVSVLLIGMWASTTMSDNIGVFFVAFGVTCLVAAKVIKIRNGC